VPVGSDPIGCPEERLAIFTGLKNLPEGDPRPVTPCLAGKPAGKKVRWPARPLMGPVLVGNPGLIRARATKMEGKELWAGI
jgi:hypothetical protein